MPLKRLDALLPIRKPELANTKLFEQVGILSLKRQSKLENLQTPFCLSQCELAFSAIK